MLIVNIKEKLYLSLFNHFFLQIYQYFMKYMLVEYARNGQTIC